jgi:glycine hydroxymethyltransferase
MYERLPGGRVDLGLRSYEQLYDRVRSLLREHHEWFGSSIPLIASENVPSPAIRAAVASDFGNRYAEGWPGA